jgi:uncharacterized protein YndB with AHSA1/START domain
MTQDHRIDTRGQLEAVERTVTARSGERDGTIRTAVILSQSYATGAEDLWEACSTADRLARWFAPVEGELRLGGRFQVQGNAGGTIETCDPPRGYSVTWEFGGEVSWLEVKVEPEGDERSRLVLTHTGDGDRGRWDQFGPGAVGIGWDLSLLGLSTHLASGAGRPAEATEWAQSDDAKAFMAASSRLWSDASVRGGTPDGDARAAEARTTAFYLGEEPPA